MTKSFLKKKKLTKTQRKKFQLYFRQLELIILGIIIGVAFAGFWYGRQNRSNIVWPADRSVKIPKSLKNFLHNTENNCEAYKGKDSPKGVGLWGVYQVSGDNYAKIAYGCSWSLTSYIMAVKYQGDWLLIQPEEYFAPFNSAIDPTKGAVPLCSVVDKYKIPKDIEPFCIQTDGTAKANEL